MQGRGGDSSRNFRLCNLWCNIVIMQSLMEVKFVAKRKVFDVG